MINAYFCITYKIIIVIISYYYSKVTAWSLKYFQNLKNKSMSKIKQTSLIENSWTKIFNQFSYKLGINLW